MSKLVVRPVLRLAVLCQSVETDGEGRPFALEAPIHTIYWPKDQRGSYEPPAPVLYVQLQGAVGEFRLRCVLRPFGDTVELKEWATLLAEEFDGAEYRITPLELDLTLPGFAVPRPGAYELYLFANYVSLHEAEAGNPIPFPPLRVTVLSEGETEGGIL